MLIGGVLLAAGMQMMLPEGATFILTSWTTDGEWVTLHGEQQPTASSPWKHRNTRVHRSALKGLLALL